MELAAALHVCPEAFGQDLIDGVIPLAHSFYNIRTHGGLEPRQTGKFVFLVQSG